MIAAAILPIQHWMIAPALALLLGVCLLVRGVRLFANRQPKSKSVTSIAAITPGQIEVRGPATGPYSIAAPFTGKTCYLYRATVWQQRRRSDGWEKLADETLHVPFYLEDSTGQLLIEPMGADLEIPIALREEYGGSFSDANTIPPAVSAFLSRHRATPTGRIMIEEFCVEPQTELFVTGSVTENPGVEVKPLVPKKINGLLSSSKANGQPQPDALEIVRLSDVSTPHAGAVTQQSKIAAALIKAGIQNPNAWEAAGLPAPSSAPGSATAVLPEETPTSASVASSPNADAQSGFNLKPALVLMKGPEDAPFVLSSRRSQPPGNTSWQDPVLLAAGAALTLTSLWIFFKDLL